MLPNPIRVHVLLNTGELFSSPCNQYPYDESQCANYCHLADASQPAMLACSEGEACEYAPSTVGAIALVEATDAEPCTTLYIPSYEYEHVEIFTLCAAA